MTELCVFIPTRKRRQLAEECIQSFRETAQGETDLFLVVDDDDDSYEGIDVPLITVPRKSLVTAINTAALALAPAYKALQLAADDMEFTTPGWDLMVMAALEDMGGSGFVQHDDKRRYDVPEHPLISSDIVQALGWFAEPGFGHFYIDNIWAELSRRAGLLRHCPAVIRHRHYTVDSAVPRDETYASAETEWGAGDAVAYAEWQNTRRARQVALLRSTFNPDVKWVLEMAAAGN